jgi:hypothetical protein
LLILHFGSDMLASMIAAFLSVLSLPSVGLPTLFIISLLSATLLPMGSEPAVFAVVKMNPELFWPAVLVATAGNTVGGQGGSGQDSSIGDLVVAAGGAGGFGGTGTENAVGPAAFAPVVQSGVSTNPGATAFTRRPRDA